MATKDTSLEEFKPGEVENEEGTQGFLDQLIRSETVPEIVKKSCRWLLENDSNRWTPYRDSDGSELDAPDDGWILSSRKRLPIETVLQETCGQWLADGDDYVPDSTDGSSLRSSRRVTLSEHTTGVVKHVCKFARLAGLPEKVSADLEIAARWHDVGKIEERFQTLLHDGDAATAMIALAGGEPLAKSGQSYAHPSERRRARRRAGLPNGVRHEALSVILLRESRLKSLLDNANDSEFVQYVIGSHHGNGRASHPVVDDQPESTETPPLQMRAAQSVRCILAVDEVTVRNLARESVECHEIHQVRAAACAQPPQALSVGGEVDQGDRASARKRNSPFLRKNSYFPIKRWSSPKSLRFRAIISATTVATGGTDAVAFRTMSRNFASPFAAS